MNYGTYDSLAEVRTALTSTTNTTGGDARSGIGGVEIQKMIDRMIVDALNRGTDIRPRIRRRPMNQLAFIWNIRTNLGSTGKAAFYSDGATGTPYPSTKVQYFAPAKAYRADYEVTGLMLAGSASYYDAIEDESRDSLDALKLLEEKSIICGSDTSAYGFANSFSGLLQLMGSNATFGDTDTIYGTARASARDELDVQLVGAGSTTTGPFDLSLLDSAITKSNKQDGGAGTKIFFMSLERLDEVSQKLQPQQRFPSQTVEGQFGLRATSYRGFELVGSRFMDKNGILWTGSKSTPYTDNAMYLLNMDDIEMRILNGVDFVHVPIVGDDSSIRKDVRGGFFKTYGVLVMRRFDNQVLIYNLATP